ncbi:MAG: class I tRNA ligase family protein [Candidatus Absconditabacteria bacterium]|nr:class I tRNA ligase family protein [Candidatus Absconditabacteria bacterium]
MIDFPKQYKQTKINSQYNSSSQNPFFFLPEQYTNAFDIQQLFRLFLLDAIHFLNYGNHIGGGYFFPDNLYHHKDNVDTSISFLKKQLKQFGLPFLISGLQTHKDLAFTFSLQNFFAEQFRKGIFFEDRFLVFRSPKYQTPVSSDLVEHIPSEKNRYTIKYFISTKNHSLDVMTESPETIFGDVAIAIHPQHKKAKQLKGQEAIIPIINKTIPIVIDERADFTRYGGVYRVTPGHDKLGLAIAKDHNLQIDKYAIDKDGYFTEHAGLFAKKSVEEFFPNIIQSLSDIGNLTKTEKFTGTIPIYKQDKEHLIFRSWKGLFVKMNDEIITSFFEQDFVTETGLNRDYIDNSYRIASSHQGLGIPVPIWTNNDSIFVIDSDWLQSVYNDSGAKGGLAFGLFILHCISTKLIDISFSAEEFVTMIFDCGGQESFEKLFSIIESKYPKTKKEFSILIKVIQNLDREKGIEKNVNQLLDILDDAFCLKKTSNGKYSFDFEKFDPKMKDIKHYGQVISYDFLTIALLLEKAQSVDIAHQINFCTTEDMLKTTVKNILFVQQYLEKPFVNKIDTLTSLKNEKNSDDFPIADVSLAKRYHPDCIRIGLLSLTDGKQLYKQGIFDDWDKSIAKFWNACRYIKTTFFNDSKNIQLKKIQQEIEKNIDKLNVFDSWILSKINILFEENQQLKSSKQVGVFVNHVFDFIYQDFSSKYLELIKSAPSEYSNNISLCIMITIIGFLKPYMPTITKELLDIFGLEQSINNDGFQKVFTIIQKNYSISLFMEIIDKFALMKSGLGLKKHDIVGIFIRSNPDFIKFAKSNEYLFKKTLNTDEVLYLVHHEDIPCGYQKEDIIDISIGLKSMSKPSISGISLLKKQLQEKEEHIQHLKNLVQQLSSNGADIDIINQKKDEISKAKKDIEDLCFEINKCKMKE